jgi:hypothetical protein
MGGTSRSSDRPLRADRHDPALLYDQHTVFNRRTAVTEDQPRAFVNRDIRHSSRLREERNRECGYQRRE